MAVSYRTANGTARAGADYRSRSGRLRFEPGETAQTVTVPVLEDAVSEAEETFTVELRAPSQATLADGTGVGTVVDDDEPPELVIDDAPGVVEGGAAEFPVRLSAAVGRTVTVSYRTADGTAVGGVDYDAVEGSLRFEEGQIRQTVAVAALADELVEGAERFTVELDTPVGATIADGTGAGTITDDADVPIEVVNRTVLPEIGRALAFTAVRCRVGRGTRNAPRPRAEGVLGGLSLSNASTAGGLPAARTGSLTFEEPARRFVVPAAVDGRGGCPGPLRRLGLRRLPQPGGRRPGRGRRLGRRGLQRPRGSRRAARRRRAGRVFGFALQGLVRLLRGGGGRERQRWRL